MVGRNARALGASLLVPFLAACGTSDAEPGVLLDGLFDEWAGAANVIDDAPDAPDSEVDLLSVQVLDDPWWLYLALDVGNEVALQSMRGTVHLLFDSDDDTSTGGEAHGMDGVDLIVDLSPRTSLRPSPGAGIRARAVAADGATSEVERHALGIVAAPTWSAPRFELRVSRLEQRGGHFDRGIRIGAVYEREGSVLDRTVVGSYDLRTTRSEDPVPAEGRLPPKSDAALRVVQWNVSSASFERNASDFARVLAALRPDVVMLDEVPSTSAPDGARGFFDLDPLRSMGAWSVVLGGAGGRQRSLVAARSGGVRPGERLRAPEYPSAALERLAARVAVGVDGPLWEDVLTSEAANGLSAAGAWVRAGDAEALFVSLDLQAAGWPGSPHDLLRAVQGEVLREHVLAEMGDRRRPVVIGGDLNLVGSRAPLFALARGLDVDGTDLTPVDAERLGERTLTTWRMPGQPFAPGRLDFLLVSDAGLSVDQAFVFATEDLADDELARLGLERDLMLRLSDHLPLVADLRFGQDGVATAGGP